MIDDLSIFSPFLKCRFLPAREIPLYFSIQMKNVGISDCAPFNRLFTFLFVFDWKVHGFAICKQGGGEKLNGCLFSGESTRDYTLFHHYLNVILTVR